MTGALSEEVDRSVKADMPSCEDWTEVKIFMTLSRIVARVSGYIFVGPELYENEEYLDLALSYTMDALGAVRAIKEWHPFLRPFVSRFLPEVRRSNQQVARMQRWLTPVMNARRKAASKPGYQKPDDMLQWMLDKQAKLGNPGDKYMARVQLSLAMAAIHTTSMTATHV